ncbi:biliverdin-producing heme oxygenase [Lysobacter arvi]|uniref:Biliverdin-producing heme oxygenase n=1 Tax=Lysobacter arvi TaxID=3038776 RepID=A0ABU1CFW2_9GAMM|nr:biliverdin-producing heme oxygenase [Lysobacter arvi]MDR0183845.1 biliverdin-producing heme oxygenase [Lysobacter arvi]
MSLERVRSQLRHATASAHRRVDALLPDGVSLHRDYAAYLRAMHRFVATSTLPTGARERYLPLLSDDLRTLGIASDATPVESEPQDRYERLGWAYVFEGSSLGARVLLRQARTLGFDDRAGARYLNEHASSSAWPDLLRQLEDSSPDAGEFDRLVAASHRAFAAVEAALVDALRIEKDRP